ncbi:MAG TPA: hypothetical protein VH277_15195 [Gemmatimonadaceae bacterium]|nr:hypothetical protein [Gemmatimonadaceae bacterium]
MYAVIRRYTVNPGGAKDLAERVDREFLPILRSVPGFVSYMYMEGGQEWGRDVLATVSIFDSKGGAEESVQRAAKWVGENLTGFAPSQPIITAGEVLSTTIIRSVAYAP